MAKKRTVRKRTSKTGEKRTEKRLYAMVDTSTTEGCEQRYSSKQYDGFHHEVITVNSYGPVCYSEEGKNHQTHSVEEIDPEVDWDSLDDETRVFIVVCRYSDGGTFGRTEGHFELLFASSDLQSCKDWAKKNYEKTKSYQ